MFFFLAEKQKVSSWKVMILMAWERIKVWYPEEGFDLQKLIQANGGPSKTKVYIYLTAKKPETSDTDDTEVNESEESSSLPGFSTIC